MPFQKGNQAILNFMEATNLKKVQSGAKKKKGHKSKWNEYNPTNWRRFRDQLNSLLMGKKRTGSILYRLNQK